MRGLVQSHSKIMSWRVTRERLKEETVVAASEEGEEARPRERDVHHRLHLRELERLMVAEVPEEVHWGRLMLHRKESSVSATCSGPGSREWDNTPKGMEGEVKSMGGEGKGKGREREGKGKGKEGN